MQSRRWSFAGYPLPTSCCAARFLTGIKPVWGGGTPALEKGVNLEGGISLRQPKKRGRRKVRGEGPQRAEGEGPHVSRGRGSVSQVGGASGS